MKNKLKKFVSICMMSLCALSVPSVKAMKPAENKTQLQVGTENVMPLLKPILFFIDPMQSFIQDPDWMLYSIKDFYVPPMYYNALPVTRENYEEFKKFRGYIRDYIVYRNAVGQLSPMTFRTAEDISRARGINDIDNIIYTCDSINEADIITMLKGNVGSYIILESNGDVIKLHLCDDRDIYLKKRNITVCFNRYSVSSNTLNIINMLCSKGKVIDDIVKTL